MGAPSADIYRLCPAVVSTQQGPILRYFNFTAWDNIAMANPTLQQLRTQAIQHTLFRPTNLKTAINRLGFVQADPIKSPAAAQDLILRHRVKDYRAGDLERRYASLDIEEDLFYAYGFLPRSIWQLLHPRTTTAMPKLEKEVLETVRRLGETHPRELEEHFGADRVVNAWGGYSKATKKALEHLHHRGLLKISRREKGIRIYQAAAPIIQEVSAVDRGRRLVLVIANVLAPVPEKTLLEVVGRVRHSMVDAGSARDLVRDLHSSGELQKVTVDGITYVSPSVVKAGADVPNVVRFLAPFDPLVWDRRRFEHLWGWAYRFEAYTPIAKRLRGYYSMPLLWGNDVIGWANATSSAGKLEVDVGFVGKRPKDAEFKRQLDEEIERMRVFLNRS